MHNARIIHRPLAGIIIGLATIFLAAQQMQADGMIVPIRPEIRVVGHWAVNYHHVDITVRDQVASVSVDQEFSNTGNGMIEVEYLFPVPPDAAIDSMTLVVNGKEFAANLMKADEARKIYEDIVRSKKDPALMQYVGYGLVKTSAFPLEPGKPAKIIVTYKQTCKKDHDLVEIMYPLNTEKFSAKAIDSVRVKIDIRSKADITNIYSPTHSIDITRDKEDPRHMTAVYEDKKIIPTTDFQLFYKESDETVGANFLSVQPRTREDGYFMMLVSPNPRSTAEKIIPKDIVVVFDRSGSMSGDKMSQTKDAVKHVLKNLNAQDNFNIIAFSDTVDTFFNTMMPTSRENVAEATERIDRTEARGGTAICDAIDAAMKNLTSDSADKSRPKYILFMTDGIPTIGKTEHKEILAAIKAANTKNIRLFAMGIGYDVNVRLLDQLAIDHNGKSEYVKEKKENIATKISSLYAKIKNPVMTDVKVEIKGLRFKDCYPRQIGDLFDGDQIVLTGRYDVADAEKILSNSSGHAQIVITGTYEGKQRAFEYPITVNQPGRNWRYDFVEKLWAVRRVGWLLDQIQLNGEKKELVDEVIALSRDYGIMTAYTAFLADERTPLSNAPEAIDRRREGWSKGDGGMLARESSATGASGQMNSDNRKALASAVQPTPSAAPITPSSGPSGGTVAADQAVVFGNTSTIAYEADQKESVANVRQIANQAVYKRSGQLWIAANATQINPEKDKGKIQTIERFGEKYFELAKTNSHAENELLSSQRDGEELLVTLQGQTYLIR